MNAFSLGRVFWIAMAVLPFYLPAGASAARPPARHFVVLHRFNTTDGSGPIGSLVQDGLGNLYGETEIGGSNGAGVAFELSPHGTRWKEAVLHNFGSADGFNPLGGLTLDTQGNLYGTEFSSATYGGGVFELSPVGDGTWNFTQIYTSNAWSQGSNPYSGVLRDDSGNLFGTTYYGGAKCCAALGTSRIISRQRDAGSAYYTPSPELCLETAAVPTTAVRPRIFLSA